MIEKYIQVVTTIDNKKKAMEITKTVVSKRLCACAQIVGPIISNYRWKNKLTTSKEWLCIMKTKKSLYTQLEAEIKKLHTYTVPEIIATPIIAGNKTYLEWIGKETKK
ncbi:MAG: divalent-cation tolerance protein CutA [bacterium]|nr:divalent-cation tolerance protein CutA [bacterium]